MRTRPFEGVEAARRRYEAILRLPAADNADLYRIALYELKEAERRQMELEG